MYSHEQLKLMDAAAISICSQQHIQSVIEELIETALAATPTQPEPPTDVARDAERYRWLREQAASIHAAGSFVWTWKELKFGVPDHTLDEAIDAAAIAAEKGGAP